MGRRRRNRLLLFDNDAGLLSSSLCGRGLMETVDKLLLISQHSCNAIGRWHTLSVFLMILMDASPLSAGHDWGMSTIAGPAWYVRELLCRCPPKRQ